MAERALASAARIVHPRRETLERNDVLNAGEMLVLDRLDQLLDPDWELYIQPTLNGLRPDIVCLHPAGRAVVVEVKDWTFERWQLRWKTRRGAAPIPERTDGDATESERNPVEQALIYRGDLMALARDGMNSRPDVRAAIVFPFADRETALTALAPALEHRRSTNVAVLGGESFADIPRSHLFRQPDGKAFEWVARVRDAIVARDAIITRLPFELTSGQLNLIQGRTASGYRRIRGAPGSGKSLVLAGRAARLSRSGNDVLVVYYNKTLGRYLKQVVRQFGGDESHITYLGFFEWCRRTMSEAGQFPVYRDLQYRAGTSPQVWDRDMPDAVRQAIDDDDSEQIRRYDAVLVDEAQDFLPDWWQCLRRVCKPDGEMVMAADPAQNIYGRAESWTEQRMTGAGFSGGWADLGASHRMPLQLIPEVRRFAETFLPEADILLPEEPPQEALPGLEDCTLRWQQIDQSELVIRTAAEVASLYRRVTSATVDPFAPGDVVLLTDTNERGREIVARLKDEGIAVLHTFSSDWREVEAARGTFTLGGETVLATTAHSFKGWEASAIVVCLGSGSKQTHLALLYSAMTRLKKSERGSFLTVVCSEERLRGFGRSWAP